MKHKFKNLRDAINFRSHCPFCAERLVVGDRYAEQKTTFDIEGKNLVRIVWRTQDNEEMIFDVDSGFVEILYKFSNDYLIYTGVDAVVNRGRPARRIYDGHLYESMKFICQSCNAYEYMIQICIDMSDRFINEIVLNHEGFCWQDTNDFVHQVKSIYTYDKTQYRYFPKGDKIYLDGVHVEEKSIDLPLILLNLDEPEKTIQRIKTLVLFS
jgi:hypothetical protein